MAHTYRKRKDKNGHPAFAFTVEQVHTLISLCGQKLGYNVFQQINKHNSIDIQINTCDGVVSVEHLKISGQEAMNGTIWPEHQWNVQAKKLRRWRRWRTKAETQTEHKQ